MKRLDVNQANIMSLAELSIGIKTVLEVNFEYIKVKGEAIQCKRYPSGHLYFTMKDNEHILDCVCWKNTKINFEPQDGLEVICSGKLTSYSGRSKYQLNIINIENSGLGEIMRAIEERKKRLAAEGLFDQSRKLSIPKYIQTLGIITSPKGAVIHDMLHRLTDRYPVKVVLYPISVQGPEASDGAIKGIKYFHDNPVAVIILARGGGSFEDLLGFQDEKLVRHIADSKIPIVTAIGHETDTTLVDYASSLRAPTPTAAIELITPNRAELLSQDNAIQVLLTKCIKKIIETHYTILNSSAKVNKSIVLDSRLQRYDYSHLRLNHAMHSYFKIYKILMIVNKPNFDKSYKEIMGIANIQQSFMLNLIHNLNARLDQSKQLLKAVSYRNTLKRGFCRAFTSKTQVTNRLDAIAQKRFSIEFQDGKVDILVNHEME